MIESRYSMPTGILALYLRFFLVGLDEILLCFGAQKLQDLTIKFLLHLGSVCPFQGGLHCCQEFADIHVVPGISVEHLRRVCAVYPTCRAHPLMIASYEVCKLPTCLLRAEPHSL